MSASSPEDAERIWMLNDLAREAEDRAVAVALHQDLNHVRSSTTVHRYQDELFTPGSNNRHTKGRSVDMWARDFGPMATKRP